MKTINNLKADIDNLKQEFNLLNADVHDLSLDNQGINEIINNRSAEVARLKAEIADVVENNNRLALEKKELEGQLNRLRNDNKAHAAEFDDLQQRIAQLNERRNKNERLIKELEAERDKVERINQDLHKQADTLRVEIRNKNDAIRYAENVLGENRKQIIALEADLNDLKRINEKTKNDIASTQKNQQAEYNKNQEAVQKINNLESGIQSKEGEIDSLRAEYENLKREHLKLIDANDDLSHDIDAAARHLDLLSLQNQDLVNEFERFSEQDEKVRAILDRRDRVADIKNRTEGKSKQSANLFNSSLRSPSRKRNDDA